MTDLLPLYLLKKILALSCQQVNNQVICQLTYMNFKSKEFIDIKSKTDSWLRSFSVHKFAKHP